MRALIVDDNVAAREIIDDLLKGVVAQADAVASGPEAIAAVKQADGAAKREMQLKGTEFNASPTQREAANTAN